jgi:hypothetical protein
MTTIDKLHPQHAFASTCILVGFEKNTRNVSFGSCNTLKVGRISPTHREISIMTNDVKTANSYNCPNAAFTFACI